MQSRSSHMNCTQYSLNLTRFSKEMNSSLSTSDCNSPRQFPASFTKPSISGNKEKSQLCKRFVENGFCPYQAKCKFAHGSHELRRNAELNQKYKTKQCGVYIKQGYCSYGQRCNFVHEKIKKRNKFECIDEDMILIKSLGTQQSKLMKFFA